MIIMVKMLWDGYAKEVNPIAKVRNPFYVTENRQAHLTKYLNWEKVELKLRTYKIEKVIWKMDAPHVFIDRGDHIELVELIPTQIYTAEFTGRETIKII